MKKIMELLEEMEGILQESSAMPFSRKVMVEKEDMLEIMKEIKEELPKEIEEAEFINREKQRIINEAKQEAKQIRNEAEMYAEKRVNEAAIVREAEERARKLEDKAKMAAEQIRGGSIDYADSVLSKVEEKLSELRTDIEDIYMGVQENKQQLK